MTRRRSSGGKITRRAALGFIGTGAVISASDTFGFSNIFARRGIGVRTAADSSALLGLDTVSSVQSGSTNQKLVTISNNMSTELHLSITLDNPDQGSVSPQSRTLSEEDSVTCTVSVASDSDVGQDALPFSIIATTDNGLSVSLTRSVNVQSGPNLVRSITDQSNQSGNNTANYRISYRAENISDFGSITVVIKNLDDSNTDTRTQLPKEGVIEYSQGNAGNKSFEFTFTVYDSNNSIVLEEIVTDISEGNNPPGNETPSGPDDPQLDSFTVIDTTEYNNTRYSVNYEVSNIESFDRVEVIFNNTNPNKDWSDETIPNENVPTGSVSYHAGNTENDTYEITVEVINENGVVVDSGTITNLADGTDPESYP